MKKFLATIALASLTACAQLGMAPADTFQKRLAAGYESVATVTDTAFALRAQDALSVKDKDRIAAAAKEALAALDAARGLSGTDLNDANARLAAAIAILSALQAELAAHGK